MEKNKYKDNPIMTITLVLLLVGNAIMCDTSWNYGDWQRPLLSVVLIFMALFVGYFIRDGVE